MKKKLQIERCILSEKIDTFRICTREMIVLVLRKLILFVSVQEMFLFWKNLFFTYLEPTIKDFCLLYYNWNGLLVEKKDRACIHIWMYYLLTIWCRIS